MEQMQEEANPDSRLKGRKRGKTGRKEADHGHISVSSHTCSVNLVTSDFWLQNLISRWGKGSYAGDRSTLVFCIHGLTEYRKLKKCRKPRMVVP